MTTQRMTPKQSEALARFIEEVRGDWDRHGVHAQLGYARDRGNVWDLAVAAIRAAQDHRNRTPAVIPMDGEHWRRGQPETPAAPPRPPAPEEFCAICGRLRPQCEQVAQLNDDGHAFVPGTRADGHLIDVETGRVLTAPATRQFLELVRLGDLDHPEGETA